MRSDRKCGLMCQWKSVLCLSILLYTSENEMAFNIRKQINANE